MRTLARLFIRSCSLAFLLAGAAATTPATAGDAMSNSPTQVQADRLDGGRYTLEGARGKVAVLVMWSPDSLSSRKSMGELERFVASYQSRGIDTIAISTLRDADALREFSAKRKLQVPVAMLADHDLGTLKEQNLPVVYVFDRDGKLASTHAGLLNFRTLERLVVPLLP